MARRRYGYYGPKPAPQPIINKAPKLDLTGLTAAYEWLAVDRTLGLRMATEWYAANTNALLFGAPLDTARQRDYDRAMKCAALGNNNTITGERETAWTMGLKGYEKVWDAKALPKVTDAISAADNGTVSKRIAAVKTVLDNVNGAFAPVGIRFAPSCGADRDFNEDTIWVPQAELEAMCAQPPLKLALTEATTVARVKSFVTVDGKTEMDGALFMTTLPVVLEGVYAWAAQAGGSLTKPVGKVRAAKSPRTPKAPGAAPTQTKYAAGTVIHIVNRKYPFSAASMRTKLCDAMQDGMTFAAYKRLLNTTPEFKGHSANYMVGLAVQHGLVTIS
jgi:hypothetical protein